ncbi:hypothetical protein HanRHA438_Chr03g0102241 [Helianthus annuus]|uniref:Uncharacterized protein n=1 Tax=Helianthus annuus TaxID=4232 RepID=A0A9K3NU75_HELAN|nr:hypothetical protein HanXRQr2_Chr03g0091031 [Helianthus annuus]KAJ0933978.1 hypothetical protein HanRHA438_Chr03g0102241 [Helianthus annuus]
MQELSLCQSTSYPLFTFPCPIPLSIGDRSRAPGTPSANATRPGRHTPPPPRFFLNLSYNTLLLD